MWFLLGSLGMIFGGLYGWFYGGQQAPPIVAAILWGATGAGFLGWVMKDAANSVGVSAERVFLTSLITALLTAIILSLSGRAIKEVWLFTFLTLSGGAGVAIHPKWVIVGVVLGAILGLIDAGYLWWTGSVMTFRESASLVLRSMVFLGFLTPTIWATYHRVWSRKKTSLWD